MSTPINRIPEDPHKTLDEDQEVVQNIIQELKEQENPPPQNQPLDNYEPQRARRQAPPARDFDFYEEDEMHPPQSRDYYSQEVRQIPHDQVNHHQPSFPQKDSYSQSIWQKLWHEAKEPLLVLILYVLSNLRVFDKLFMRYIPRMSTDIGTLNFMGILAKAIIVTMIFFLFKKFIK